MLRGAIAQRSAVQLLVKNMLDALDTDVRSARCIDLVFAFAVTSSETICKLYFSLNFYEARSPLSASDSADQYVNQHLSHGEVALLNSSSSAFCLCGPANLAAWHIVVCGQLLTLFPRRH